MRFMAWVRRNPLLVAVLLRDGLFLAGAALLVSGIGQIHRPSAFIMAGVLLMVPTLRAALRRRGNP